MRTVSTLAHLASQGILVRTAGRLRVSSRFLAQAEQAACEGGLAFGLESSLSRALVLAGYTGDVGAAARYLAEFMAERGQAGLLQPAFPTGRLVAAT